MTPGGERETAGRLPLWGDMADDAKHMKRRPVTRYPGYQRLLPGSPRGAGAEGKRKAASPMEAARSNLNRGEVWFAAPVAPTIFAGAEKRQEPPARCRRPPGRGTSESLPEKLRPRPRWPRPSRDESKNSHVPIDHRHVAAPVPATTGGYFQNGKHRVLWSLPVRGGSFSLHPRRPSLRGGVKSETVVELFCRKSPGGVSHLPQRPQRSSPCLFRPPSRRGLSAVSPAVPIPALVSLVRAYGGASFAPTPRLLGASLPLRRYVRRVGFGTWPRGAVFPAFPVVHEDILQK